MPLFPRRTTEPHGEPMTASAQKIDSSQILSDDTFRRRTKAWQNKVLRFSDMIPEVSSAGKFVENSIGRVDWEAMEKTADGSQACTNDVVNKLVDSLDNLDSGRLANMIFSVGEGYLVVTPAEVVAGRSDYTYWNPTGTDYYWRSVSISEIDVQDGRVAVRLDPYNRDKKQYLLPGQEIYRVWSPDKSYAQDAWSSHRPMLEILEAMVLHTIADKIYALSIVSNAGILYIPNDDFLPEPYDNTGPPLPGTVRDFDEKMNEAMRLALSNTSGSESISPLKMYGKSANSNGLKHLLLDRVDNAAAYATRMDAYRLRYATGVDLPAEVVTGIASSNHWSSWKVDQNTWTYHLAPMAESIAVSILEAWLIPKLVQMGVADPTKYFIRPNGRNVVSKPDNTPTILDLYRLGAIDSKSALTALDMPVDWAQDEFHEEQPPQNPDGPPIRQRPGAVPTSPVDAPPTRTGPDNAPAVKAASAAQPQWLKQVGDVESHLYSNILEEMRRSSTRAISLGINPPAKSGDASQDMTSQQAVDGTNIGLIVYTLLKKAAEDRFATSSPDNATELLDEYMRSRGAAIESAASFATQYVSNLLASRMYRQSINNPDGSAIPSDYVPPVAALAVMSIAAGGDPAQFDQSLLKSNTAVRNWNADPLWLEAVGRATGMKLGLEFIWELGHPRFPYPEHVALAGESWREGDENPTAPFFPGDHHGCQCRIIGRPYVPS